MSPRVRAVLLPAVLVILGIVLLFAGEADDSPGLGGIGLILAIAATVVGVRAYRRVR